MTKKNKENLWQGANLEHCNIKGNPYETAPKTTETQEIIEE